MRHRVIFEGGAQTLYHRPMRNGSPVVVASATYRIVDLARNEDDSQREIVAAGTSATLSAVSTTISAAAGYSASDPQVVTVASATGITAGRTYLLRSSSLVAEPVTVDSISGTTIRLERAVTQTFAASSPFLGYEIAATFPSAQANDESDFDAGYTLFAVDWTYDGRTTRELITIVRTAAQCPITGAEIRERVPGILPRIGSTYDADAFASAAWLSVRGELNRHGLKPDELISDEDVVQATCYLAAVHILLSHGDEQATNAREFFQSEYRRVMAGLTAGVEKDGNVVTNRDGALRAPQERRRIVERA